jgi:biotin carboxyl carrier protein
VKLPATIIIAVVFLFHASPASGPMTGSAASRLYHRLQFAMTSESPGAAVAVRLRENSSDQKALLCFRGECLHITHQWQLIATDPDGPEKQIFTLEDETHAYAFRQIGLHRDIFDQAHGPIAHLRLPSSVIAKIGESRTQIDEQESQDQILFSHSEDKPWSSQWVAPVHGAVVSRFHSERVPPNGQPYAHTGVDLRAGRGTRVRASSDGVVVSTATEVIGGNVVTIDHGRGVMSRYMHLSKFLVKPGDQVKTGDVIALSGSTGRAEAPHLHWEIRIRGRPVDPVSTQRLLARLYDLE